MFSEYADLKKAYVSVHRNSLWDTLRTNRIPAKVMDLMTGLCSRTTNNVYCGGDSNGQNWTGDAEAADRLTA